MGVLEQTLGTPHLLKIRQQSFVQFWGWGAKSIIGKPEWWFITFPCHVCEEGWPRMICACFWSRLMTNSMWTDGTERDRNCATRQPARTHTSYLSQTPQTYHGYFSVICGCFLLLLGVKFSILKKLSVYKKRQIWASSSSQKLALQSILQPVLTFLSLDWKQLKASPQFKSVCVTMTNVNGFTR